MTSFKLPNIGEGVEYVTVTDILITENQNVTKDDIVIIVESEKASMEIPINENCLIVQIHVTKGDKISPKDIILTINSQNTNINDDIDKHNEIVNENIKMKTVS